MALCELNSAGGWRNPQGQERGEEGLPAWTKKPKYVPKAKRKKLEREEREAKRRREWQRNLDEVRAIAGQQQWEHGR